MIGSQQSLFFQYIPEGRRNLNRHGIDIEFDALGSAGAQRQRDDAGMRFSELDAYFRWRLPMLLTEREEFLAPGELFLIGGRCRIELDVVEEFTAGQEAGIKKPPS